VCRIALFVDAPLEEALATSAVPGIDAVQFHGNESREYLEAFSIRSNLPILRAVRLDGENTLAALDQVGSANVLLDAAVSGAFGGTGVAVDWGLARRAVDTFPQLRIFLAGGLTPENVGEAVAAVRPFAVDVASGVESGTPGRKDAGKVRAFVRAAKQARI
jgi:phosphoribosylanthranilate isomerase